MRFRPCIDIHNGKVKQIVGGSLKDSGDYAVDNFVSEKDAAWFARFYEKDELKGGHIIMLNPVSSPWFEATRAQAEAALGACPGTMQIGGGIHADNAEAYLEAGASHVIVTSYVFRDGRINLENLEKIRRRVGREHLVLDLSCRRKDGTYYIVTDRWQKFTEEELTPELLDELAGSCSEFLIHAVDVEGRAGGIEEGVARMLGDWGKIPVTYAGGVSGFEDLETLKKLGREKVDVTIGSALDLFGGSMPYNKVLSFFRR
ncbi:MAG: phosphoribosylformimino-5-aminoimidazole carboxamide ribotide isomerase [Lachnospiraceae bacterium]|nr:phosphoribosylformimino-5-aminoimidazole carboxamide ribotide isomerase [Lachnospiraceae bacterium]MDY4969773.1 phosphoribosylformimino-5-aminoimidazole carboxamide ribotide isomerase [Lachnospiraceae bacterium]